MTVQRLGERQRMPTSEKDLLAAEAMDRWEDFQESLSSEKRRYPIQQFRAFWLAATRYAELTKSDSLLHRVLPPQSTDSSISLARAHRCCLRHGR